MFDYETITPGYYDLIFRRGRGAQSKWHHLKFARVAEEIAGCSRHLDIGCGPGDRLSSLPEVNYTGFDLDPNYIAAATRRPPSSFTAWQRVSFKNRIPDSRIGCERAIERASTIHAF